MQIIILLIKLVPIILLMSHSTITGNAGMTLVTNIDLTHSSRKSWKTIN